MGCPIKSYNILLVGIVIIYGNRNLRTPSNYLTNKPLYIILLFIIVALITCKNGINSIFSKEGEIHYDIVYLENDLDKISTDLLPKKMVTKYKNNIYSFEIEGFFGLFNIKNVVNPKESKNETQLTVLNKKYYHTGNFDDFAVGFGEMPEMQIQYTDETKLICGIPCSKAIITFRGNVKESIEVFFTQSIPLKQPNRTTPYHDIDGVLMEFYLDLQNIEMKITANAVYDKKLPKSVFGRKEGFKKATKPYIEAVLLRLLQAESETEAEL